MEILKPRREKKKKQIVQTEEKLSFPLAFGNVVSKRLSVNMAEPWEAKRSEELLNKYKGQVWTPLSLPTVPDQHTTNPQPLYSLSVKLLKSLTVANDVFVFGTYYKRFRKGCFLPHQWVLGGLVAMPGHWQEPGGVTGCRRGSEKEGEWRQFSSLAQLFVFFFKSSFWCRVGEGVKGERSNWNTQTQYWRQCFWAYFFMPNMLSPQRRSTNQVEN